MRSENVPESPSSALQAMYFCAACLVEHRLPLDTRGKRRAAAAAQPGVRDARTHDLLRRHRQRRTRARVAAVRQVVIEARGIDDAEPCAGEPLLSSRARDDARCRRAAAHVRRRRAFRRRSRLANVRGVAPGRRRLAPRRVTTSTSGSSQYSTARSRAHDAHGHRRARCILRDRARATASAPSETAPESPGTYTVMAAGALTRTLRKPSTSSSSMRGRHAAVELSIEHRRTARRRNCRGNRRCRASRAPSARVSPKFTPRCFTARAASASPLHRLAGFRSAELEPGSGPRARSRK